MIIIIIIIITVLIYTMMMRVNIIRSSRTKGKQEPTNGLAGKKLENVPVVSASAAGAATFMGSAGVLPGKVLQ